MILYLHGLKRKKHSAPTDCWPLKYNNKYMLTNASGQISPGKRTPVTLALLPEPNFQPVAILWLPWNLPGHSPIILRLAPDNRTRGSMTRWLVEFWWVLSDTFSYDLHSIFHIQSET